eukprot:TRINITY_DN36546_c0_g1_i1.p1 TRINITY_DN36546_c0_g1~~TRINITY_DN36546_c0_g1_i1.p1  ORF type:complete len:649 (+),score=204.50 TRINITY_DN36546_c0_g1_i1:62-2008(+)
MPLRTAFSWSASRKHGSPRRQRSGQPDDLLSQLSQELLPSPPEQKLRARSVAPLRPELLRQLEERYHTGGAGVNASIGGSTGRGVSFAKMPPRRESGKPGREATAAESSHAADTEPVNSSQMTSEFFKVVDNVPGLPESAWIRDVPEKERTKGAPWKLLLWFLITNHTSAAWCCRVGYPAVATALEDRLSLGEGEIANIGTGWAVGSLLAVFIAPKVFAKGGPRVGSLVSVAGVPCAALLLALAVHLKSFGLVILSHALQGMSAVCTLTFQNVFLNAFFPDGKDMRMAFAWDGVWRSAMFAGSPGLATAVQESLGLSAVAWLFVCVGGFSVMCNCALFLLMMRRGDVDVGQTGTTKLMGICDFLLSVRRFKARTVALLIYALVFEASWTPLLWFGGKFLQDVWGYGEAQANFWVLTAIQTTRLISGPLIGLSLSRYGKRSVTMKVFSLVVVAAPLTLAMAPDFGSPPAIHPGVVSIPFGVAIAGQYCLVNVALPVGVKTEDLSTVYTYHSGMMSLGALLGTALFGVLLHDPSEWAQSFVSLSVLAAFGAGLVVFLHLNEADLPPAARPLARMDFWVRDEASDTDADAPVDPRMRACSYGEFLTTVGGAKVYQNFYANIGGSALEEVESGGEESGGEAEVVEEHIQQAT